MSEIPDPPSWFGWVSGVIGGILASSAAWVWRIRDAIAATERNVAEVENDLLDKMAAMERGFQQALDSSMRVLQRDIGEIKDIVHKQDLFVRDNYARRESVAALAADIKGLIERGLDKVDRQIRDDKDARAEIIDLLREDIIEIGRQVSAMADRK